MKSDKVGATLSTSFAGEEPEKLINDKAYDSDPLDLELAEQGSEMIAPHKLNRKKPATQDGRIPSPLGVVAGKSNA